MSCFFNFEIFDAFVLIFLKVPFSDYLHYFFLKYRAENNQLKDIKFDYVPGNGKQIFTYRC